jgi:membrane peptidoglycan carboxypeptidase
MIGLLRLLTRPIELALLLPLAAAKVVVDLIAFNPRLGPLRYVTMAGLAYVVFAVILVYVVAPIRGFVGDLYMGERLRYDAERWVATAIYDKRGDFIGTFDPRLDSRRDVNYTDAAIELGDYVANPDHKSIPVREVPPQYWQCLLYHEDRYLGGWLNPFGIDLAGVLKIPYSTVKRSIALKRPSLGVGGSTLPMQFARVIYKTPPAASEGGFTKFARKLREWWLAPVIYHELTKGGDNTPLKQWAANHIWLAQRTGGQPLHGVEVTSRIVFGKDAKDLSTAEQFVLASAVNKPIILLQGNERLNGVRLDRWRYITEVRARTCAEKLIGDEAEKQRVVFELIAMAGGPPDPKVKPRLQQALDAHAPGLAKRAQANPMIRANALMPAARFGLREEMKQSYGFGWRDYVRGLTTTFDAVDNLAFSERIKAELSKIDAASAGRIDAGWTLDPAKVGAGVKSPNVILVAANANGEIVRYYEAGETAPYFGTLSARDPASGTYDPKREPRMIASTGKMIAAISIANEAKDTADTLYTDTNAPARGLETCDKGGQTFGRKALVAFACSLNNPVGHRLAQVGQERVRRIIDGLGFNMPPRNAGGEGTPPSTAAVLGLISGSPRRVHQMSGVVLGALIERGGRPVKAPTLVKSYDYTAREHARSGGADATAIIPDKLIRRGAHGLIRTLLQAPLCYQTNGHPHGTLKSLAQWCAARRAGLRLHFAKTGTMVTADPNVTVDAWLTGGLQFQNGAAYSYVVVVGSGSSSEPWAHHLHAAQIAAPLANVLLTELEADAKKHPMPGLLPSKRLVPVAGAQSGATSVASSGANKPGGLHPLPVVERERLFRAN